jgi:hypothetical protein
MFETESLSISCLILKCLIVDWRSKFSVTMSTIHVRIYMTDSLISTRIKRYRSSRSLHWDFPGQPEPSITKGPFPVLVRISIPNSIWKGIFCIESNTPRPLKVWGFTVQYTVLPNYSPSSTPSFHDIPSEVLNWLIQLTIFRHPPGSSLRQHVSGKNNRSDRFCSMIFAPRVTVVMVCPNNEWDLTGAVNRFIPNVVRL